MDRLDAITTRLNALGAKASGVPTGSASGNGPSPDQGVDFSPLLRQTIDGVNEQQRLGDSLKNAYEIGKSNDLARVMLESQKGLTALQGLTAVRNRLVDAYQELNRMPL
jgi:flagellar hook-basal body complex protein FliE